MLILPVGALILAIFIFAVAAGFAQRDMVQVYNRDPRRGRDIEIGFFNRSTDLLPKDFDMSALEPSTQREIRRYRFWSLGRNLLLLCLAGYIAVLVLVVWLASGGRSA